jgi:Protein of unknown function (DUF3237)
MSDPSRPPELELLTHAEIQVAAPRSLGTTPAGGVRRIIDVISGRFDGPRLSGTVLPGGADWQVVRPSGTTILEARFTLQTDTGALVYIQNHAIRSGPPDVMARLVAGELVDPGDYDFFMTPRFETGEPELAWLNDVVAVGSGARRPDAVEYTLWTLG